MTFHAKCERLDYSATELKRMNEQGNYLCSACDALELRDAGYNPEEGRFVWRCKHCTKTFEADDHHAANTHGARCATQLNKRQWSCSCNGKMGSSTIATQCKHCSLWFHHNCKSQQRDSWEVLIHRPVKPSHCFSRKRESIFPDDHGGRTIRCAIHAHRLPSGVIAAPRALKRPCRRNSAWMVESPRKTLLVSGRIKQVHLTNSFPESYQLKGVMKWARLLASVLMFDNRHLGVKQD